VTIGPDDEIFCVDNGDHTVKKFTKDGSLLLTIESSGGHSERMTGIPFNRPTHLAIDPNNADLYVSDGYGNARVHKYTSDGKYLDSWGESGTDPGQFNIVHNIAVDSQGLVYVADRENHRIQIFSPEGEFINQWVNFSRAAALCIREIDGRECAFVGEYFGGIAANDIAGQLGPRVTILDLNGNVLERLGRETYGSQTGRFYCPHGIDVDSNGDIYVAEVSWSDFGSKMNPPRELRSLQKLTRIKE
jgi:DNA-binding beta-propeller fold protein YncE